MILCAAIRVTVPRRTGTEDIVMAGHRHMDVHYLLSTLKIEIIGDLVEGFIDHEGNFLDRYDAFEHAVNCGQISRTTLDHKEAHFEVQLFSEDLY